MKKTITLIIPAYNEEENISPFYDECKETFKENEYNIEYIFINDGSDDNTYKRMKSLVEENKSEKIVVLNFSRNFGKEAAILAGLEHSNGDYTVIIDADLQQHPEYTLSMADILDKNADIDCVACYIEKRNESKLMISMKKFFYRMINRISDIKFEENASDFRMMRSCMVKSILSMKEYYRFSKGLFQWVGFNTYYMPYEVKDRNSGESKWSFRKLVSYAVDGFVGFSTAPLKISSWVGMVGACAGIIYFIIVLIQKLVYGINISGYATIVCLILIIGSIQMILMGITGEYIARTYIEVKNRPIYIIKEKYEEKVELCDKEDEAL